MDDASRPAGQPLGDDRRRDRGGISPTGLSRAESAVEPLWRVALGRRLRDARRAQGRTLSDTARRAGISTQYLSEVERGRKDPSSEIIAAIAGALGHSLGEIAAAAAGDLLAQTSAAPVGSRLRLVRPLGDRMVRAELAGGAGRSMGRLPAGPVAIAA
jgi:transcriptional regulator with XRE-family HTH domain